MKKFFPLFISAVIISAVFSACVSLHDQKTSDTYFVKADGHDRNSGLSEEEPFRSLFKAVVMANATSVKTITIIGTLDAESEQSQNRERVFLIQGMERTPILIRGMNSDSDPPVLSAQGSGRRAVLVRGNLTIRFEDIEISGGYSLDEGGGLVIGPGSSVILGKGALVCNNRAEGLGGGVLITPGGSLVIDGGRILDNSAELIGGGIAMSGPNSTLVMTDGEVRGNHAQGGGGIAVFQESHFTLSGGSINNNISVIAGGGLIINQEGSFTMEGGIIQDNSSSGSGGGIALMGNSALVMENGEIQRNHAAEYGGGIAGDDTGTIKINGGLLSSNRAVIRGGGIFTAGPFLKSGGEIYGSDMAEDSANNAPSGAAIFIFFEDGFNKTRDISAGGSIILDADTEDGWVISEE